MATSLNSVNALLCSSGYRIVTKQEVIDMHEAIILLHNKYSHNNAVILHTLSEYLENLINSKILNVDQKELLSVLLKDFELNKCDSYEFIYDLLTIYKTYLPTVFEQQDVVLQLVMPIQNFFLLKVLIEDFNFMQCIKNYIIYNNTMGKPINLISFYANIANFYTKNTSSHDEYIKIIEYLLDHGASVSLVFFHTMYYVFYNTKCRDIVGCNTLISTKRWRELDDIKSESNEKDKHDILNSQQNHSQYLDSSSEGYKPVIEMLHKHFLDMDKSLLQAIYDNELKSMDKGDDRVPSNSCCAIL